LDRTRNNDKGKNGKRNPARSRPLLVEITGRSTTEERTTEKEKEYKLSRRIAFWTMITGIGTVIAAGLAGVAAWIFWNQLGTMEAQLTEQEKDFRIDQRPIISDDDTATLPQGAKLGSIYDSETKLLGWNYAIRNFGKSTALNIHQFEYISILGSHFKIAVIRVTNDLAPSRWAWSTAYFPNSVSQDDINKIIVTDSGIIVKVIVKYKDIYGTVYDGFICYQNKNNRAIGSCTREQVDSIPTDGSRPENDYK
jgi:hypothetical protein